jgi:hypothetical protein
VELLLILLAFCLPAILGMTWVNLLVPGTTIARISVIAGNGVLLGLLVIPLLMRLLDAIGVGLSFPVTVSVSSALILLAGLMHVLLRSDKEFTPAPMLGYFALPKAQKALFLLFILLSVVHVVTTGIELLGRPLYPFDATMHWATKSRVWFETGQIVSFVDNKQWLELDGIGVFTDHHPDYPITIPLLQVWMNSAIGRWDESLMNLPWLLCLIGLGMAFYGQARVAGIGALMSIAFTYLLLSMPLINTHVALAGYADLFLGFCYCAALMAFHNWTVSKEPWQAVLALVFVIFCTLIKNEGFYWLLTFFPALVVVLMPGRRAAVLLTTLLLLLLILLVYFPRDLVVAGHSINFLKLGYRPQALAGIATSFWVHGNWHLFAYLLIGILPLGFILSKQKVGAYRGIITALACAIGLFLFLFTSTRYASGAIRFSSVGRVGVQLVPGTLFLIALFAHAIVSRDSAPSVSTASTT